MLPSTSGLQKLYYIKNAAIEDTQRHVKRKCKGKYHEKDIKRKKCEEENSNQFVKRQCKSYDADTSFIKRQDEDEEFDDTDDADEDLNLNSNVKRYRNLVSCFEHNYTNNTSKIPKIIIAKKQCKEKHPVKDIKVQCIGEDPNKHIKKCSEVEDLAKCVKRRRCESDDSGKCFEHNYTKNVTSEDPQRIIAKKQRKQKHPVKIIKFQCIGEDPNKHITKCSEVEGLDKCVKKSRYESDDPGKCTKRRQCKRDINYNETDDAEGVSHYYSKENRGRKSIPRRYIAKKQCKEKHPIKDIKVQCIGEDPNKNIKRFSEVEDLDKCVKKRHCESDDSGKCFEKHNYTKNVTSEDPQRIIAKKQCKEKYPIKNIKVQRISEDPNKNIKTFSEVEDLDKCVKGRHCENDDAGKYAKRRQCKKEINYNETDNAEEDSHDYSKGNQGRISIPRRYIAKKQRKEKYPVKDIKVHCIGEDPNKHVKRCSEVEDLDKCVKESRCESEDPGKYVKRRQCKKEINYDETESVEEDSDYHSKGNQSRNSIKKRKYKGKKLSKYFKRTLYKEEEKEDADKDLDRSLKAKRYREKLPNLNELSAHDVMWGKYTENIPDEVFEEDMSNGKFCEAKIVKRLYERIREESEKSIKNRRCKDEESGKFVKRRPCRDKGNEQIDNPDKN